MGERLGTERGREMGRDKYGEREMRRGVCEREMAEKGERDGREMGKRLGESGIKILQMLPNFYHPNIDSK